jgi:glutamine amidotransferase
MPEVAALADLLGHLTAEVSRHGTFNYLLSNGELLFAHCADRLSYVLRQAPFTTAHLLDEDVEVDFSEVTTLDDRVAVIATAPLTDNEPWIALASGELAAFRNGGRVDID